MKNDERRKKIPPYGMQRCRECIHLEPDDIYDRCFCNVGLDARGCAKECREAFVQIAEEDKLIGAHL